MTGRPSSDGFRPSASLVHAGLIGAEGADALQHQRGTDRHGWDAPTEWVPPGSIGPGALRNMNQPWRNTKKHDWPVSAWARNDTGRAQARHVLDTS